MRALNRTLTLICLIGLTYVASGCGQDFHGKIACTDDKSCVAKTGTLFQDGGDPALLPQCCSGYCVLPSGGCDTGYRYLNNDPGYGDCVAEDPMCKIPPDMSQPEQPGDMAQSQSD
jgi:hypothetical protein